MALRGSGSKRRPMANRRAYRPDRHIYRDLRRRSQHSFTWITAVEILIILLVLAGVIWAVRWAIS